ncbi:hypothetical protein V5O48_016146, partial [Marasmius crinis-equi]
SPSVGKRGSNSREEQQQIPPQRSSPLETPDSLTPPGQLTKGAMEDQPQDDLDGSFEQAQQEEERASRSSGNTDEIPVLRAQLGAVMQRLAILETQPPPAYVSSNEHRQE